MFIETVPNRDSPPAVLLREIFSTTGAAARFASRGAALLRSGGGDDGGPADRDVPNDIAQGEMPPLWGIGAEGDGQLVNYRVKGNHMIVDRLFAAAELKLGGKHQQTVRIVRTDGR